MSRCKKLEEKGVKSCRVPVPVCEVPHRDRESDEKGRNHEIDISPSIQTCGLGKKDPEREEAPSDSSGMGWKKKRSST